jgi:hypothetical protein
MLKRLLAMIAAMLMPFLGVHASPAPDDPAALRGLSRENVKTEAEFSVAVAERLIGLLRQGLLAQEDQRILQLFDSDMPGFDVLSAQIKWLCTYYDSLRLYTHILQAAADNPGGVATVEFTLEAVPPNDMRPPLRRSAELRFRFARRGKTWTIASFEPRDYFAGFQ